MSDLTINVSVLGGTSFESAVKDALELRRKTGTNVEFTFNGVHVFICRENQTPRDLLQKYDKAIHSGNLVI